MPQPTVTMPRFLTKRMVDAIYASDLNCVAGHDLTLDELRKLYKILVENRPAKEATELVD